MPYDAVIFDLFGTLIDNFSRREYEGVLGEMADTLGVSPEAFTASWLATFDQRALGHLPSVEANIEHCLKILDAAVDSVRVAAAVALRMGLTERALVPRPGAIEVLYRLRAAGYRLGLISDCSSEVPLLWPATPFATLFDTELFSCQVGLKKPDPRIYRLACDRLRVAAERCLYVGDGSSRELSGAAAVGMQPVLLRAAHEDLRDAHRIDAEEWSGQGIASLTEVLSLV